MSKTFCIVPWVHLSITPSGGARLCCQASQHIHQDEVPMSVYTHSIEEIWNSDYMRSVRRAMLAGEKVFACKVCDAMDADSQSAYRSFVNNEWKEIIGSFDDLIASSKNNDFKVKTGPCSFHLILGNKCNLKCRMCNPLFSSQVAGDDVHRKWWPPVRLMEPGLVTWKEGSNIIGPEQKYNVSSSGFHHAEIRKDKYCLRWTRRNACLSFVVPPHLKVDKLRLKLWKYHPWWRRMQISLNGKILHREWLAQRPFDKEFDVSQVVDSGSVNLCIKSNALNISRGRGVAVEKVEAICSKSGLNVQEYEQGSGRACCDSAWFDQKEWLIQELLKEPGQMKELQFSGGEPMVQPQVVEIVDYCISRNVAQNIALQFNINCTVLPDGMIEKLKLFKRLFIALSVDAYDPYWEYIRYPGKWKAIDRNIRKLDGLSNAKIMFVPVLQVYNALNIVELVKYAESLGRECWMYPLTNPWYLNVSVLPFKARQLAAHNLRDHAEKTSTEQMRGHLQNMANHVESIADNCTPESLRTLMLFTNDMDSTRGQSFRETHGQLLDIIKDEGFKWTDEKRYAPEERVANE